LLVVAGYMGTPGAPNWTAAYGLGAVLMVLNGLLILMAPSQPATAPGARVKDKGASAREWAALRQQPIWLLALGLVMLGLVWPVLGPVAKAADWPAIVALSGAWWFKGAVPVGLMFLGAGLMVVAAHGPQAKAMAE